MKLRNVKRKVNFLDQSKTDIEVNNSTEVSAITDDYDIALLYKSIDYSVADYPVVTVATVLREKG